jgi:type IV pilus assembly protein PilX
MRNRFEFINHRSHQSGVVLFIALILLVILSMIGVTVARMQTVEERMARNEDNRQLAAQAAEAALRNAEDGLLSSPGISQFAGNTGGYYVISPSTGSMLPTINWNNPSQVTTYTGPALSAMPAAVQTPKIVVEYLGGVALPGEDQANPPIAYRVTVQAANADGTPSSSMLQSIYR